jgi:hypothetical protein
MSVPITCVSATHGQLLEPAGLDLAQRSWQRTVAATHFFVSFSDFITFCNKVNHVKWPQKTGDSTVAAGSYLSFSCAANTASLLPTSNA